MVTDEEMNLVEKRLEAWNEKIKIASISGENLDKNQMLKNVKDKTGIGQQLVDIQLNYLKKLKERAR